MAYQSEPTNGDSPGPPATYLGPDELKESEEQGNDTGSLSAPTSDLSKAETATSLGLYTSDDSVKLVTKAGSFIKRHKKSLLIGGGAGAVVVVPILAILLFLAGTLELPNFAANVSAYQFAKLVKQNTQSAANVTKETLALDSLSSGARQLADSQYSQLPIYSDLANLNLGNVVSNLKANDLARYQITGSTSDWKLNSVIVEGEIISDTQSSTPNSLLNTSNVLGSQTGTVINQTGQALRVQDPSIPLLVRGSVVQDIISGFDGSLDGVNTSKFSDQETPQAAEEELEQESYDTVTGDTTPPPLSNTELNTLEDEAAESTAAAVDNPNTLGALVTQINNGGGSVPATTSSLVTTGVDTVNNTITTNLIGLLNPVYPPALAACIVYDGSRVTQSSVDGQDSADEREAMLVLSSADQQKDGLFNTAAAQAFSTKLSSAGSSDFNSSNVLQRANGQTVNTLSGPGTGQRSMLGTYAGTTIFDVILGGSAAGQAFASQIDAKANVACPALTNPVLNVAVGATILIGSDGTSLIGDLGADAGFTTIAKTAITNLWQKFAAQIELGGGWKAFIGSTARTGSMLFAATNIAKLAVLQGSGSFNNGLETGAAFDNNVDNGANLFSNQVEQTNFYGRPLSNTEVALNNTSAQNTLADYNKTQSTYNRYFAIANPNSLLSRLAIAFGSLTSRSGIRLLVNNLATVFNPVGLAAKVFSPLNSRFALAASSQDTQDYGNVQFGYSGQEVQLMNQPGYASPIANSATLAKELSAMGMSESDLQTQYGKCFIEPVGTLLTDGNGLPGSNSINVDANGNVTDEGTCSPQNLGPNNPQYPQYPDVVFRWRLEQNYQNEVNNLLGIQNVGTTTTSTGNGQ